MRRTMTPLGRHMSIRRLSTSPHHLASPFNRGPAPPRLPKEEQELFEKLQKASTGAFSTPRQDSSPSTSTSTSTSTPTSTKPNIRVQINQSPDSSPSTSSTPPTPTFSSRPQINQSPDSNSLPTPTVRIKEGEDLHPNMRRGAPPEFEGDVNPKTGEVGGPKNEPLRWGATADWSYNGRVTDF